MSKNTVMDEKMSQATEKCVEQTEQSAAKLTKRSSESPKKDKKKKPITSFPLFDKKLSSHYFRNAKTILSLANSQEPDDTENPNVEDIKPTTTTTTEQNPADNETNQDSGSLLKCSYCQVSFEEAAEHRNHYKQDWHRYNLKRSLEGKPPVQESEFDILIEGKDADTLSISGSDTDSDQEEDGFLELQRNPKFFFQTGSGEILSVYKTALVDPKNKLVQPSDEQLLSLIDKEDCSWAIFMVGGGHFAAAIFKGGETVVHKTFHSYTVRRKQGGSQGAADNRSGAHKSAGASLRRYNEQMHIQHIQDITKQWEKELLACSLIFVRASSYSRATLFQGKTPALKKSDPRLRSVPFPTKRATFSEVKRVYEALSKVEILQTIPIENLNSKSKKAAPVANVVRSKSRESKQRELPGYDIVQEETENAERLGEKLENLSVEEKDAFEQNRSPKKKTKKKAGKGEEGIGEKNSQNEKARLTIELENQMLTAVRTGNTKLLNQTLQLLEEEFTGVELEKERESFLNKGLGDQKLTYLHFASQAGHRPLVKLLLELGANPANKDRGGRVAYMLAKDKETRNVFITARSNFPDRYDWKKSLVPEPLTPEQMQHKADKDNEKKKAKQAERKQKLKEKKEQEKIEKQKEEEKNRYLALSDREKRALAAERRIQAMAGTAIVLNRCFQCGVDITGKVPFVYDDNNFCTVNCVKKHRTTNP